MSTFDSNLFLINNNEIFQKFQQNLKTYSELSPNPSKNLIKGLSIQVEASLYDGLCTSGIIK